VVSKPPKSPLKNALPPITMISALVMPKLWFPVENFLGGSKLPEVSQSSYEREEASFPV
jgi:hypothetical protein